MTRPGCDHSVRVQLDVKAEKLPGAGKAPRAGLRTFIVEYDADGNIIRIKEVKQLVSPQSGIYHAPYWKAGTHPLGGDNSLPRRIIAAAAAKRLATDRAANATP